MIVVRHGKPQALVLVNAQIA